jgi:hypothetical protein
LFKPPHVHGSSAADWAELYGTIKHPLRALKRRSERAKKIQSRMQDALTPAPKQAAPSPKKTALEVLS